MVTCAEPLYLFIIYKLRACASIKEYRFFTLLPSIIKIHKLSVLFLNLINFSILYTCRLFRSSIFYATLRKKTTVNSVTKIRLSLNVKDASIHTFVIIKDNVGHRKIKFIICTRALCWTNAERTKLGWNFPQGGVWRNQDDGSKAQLLTNEIVRYSQQNENKLSIEQSRRVCYPE